MSEMPRTEKFQQATEITQDYKKSSPPVPDIPLSVTKIERSNVVTGPTGIIGMVAIVFPECDSLPDSLARKQSPINTTSSHATFLPW